MTRVYNFGAGPAMLPTPVMEQVQAELLNYHGIGASIVEISHRTPMFREILEAAENLFRELTDLPKNYRVLFMHGGAQMQFSAVPLNLMNRKSGKAAFFITGKWGQLAEKEAQKYGKTQILMDGKDSGYKQIPEFEPELLDPECSYAHLTTNNTLYGTRWQQYPNVGEVPLVGDATSDILSRVMDYSQFGILFAGLQKNLGTSGTALVAIREDLIGNALAVTPKLLNYKLNDENKSIPNTINVFAIYVMRLMLDWVKAQGGVAEMEKRAIQKSALIYEILDNSDFYQSVAHPEHRSTMNVTFHFKDKNLQDRFMVESNKEGLFALKGHAEVGGARASLYNAMPVAGAAALANFMKEFERKNG